MKKVAFRLVLLLEHWVFRWTVLFSGKKKIVFLDIDNTLADTWPTLVPGKSYPSERVRLQGLLPLSGSVAYVEKHFQPEFHRVFLSHRSFLSFQITKTWLRQQGLMRPGDQLFLVTKVSDKEWFFKYAASARGFSDVVVMDELSFGHELGKGPSFYEQVISRIQSAPIQYLDYDFIQKLNDLEESDRDKASD